MHHEPLPQWLDYAPRGYTMQGPKRKEEELVSAKTNDFGQDALLTLADAAQLAD